MAKEKKEVEVVEEAVVEKPKKEAIVITASFKAVDDTDGSKVKMDFTGTGSTVGEALAEIDFPKGVNALVNIAYKKGSKSMDKNVPPHVSQAVLVDKDEFAFDKLFRGF